MKRTLLLTMDFPPQFGGVANYWANLCRCLKPDSLVVLTQESNSSLDFDIKQNYLIYRRNLLSKKEWLWPKWLPFFFYAMKLAQREKINKIIVAQVLPGGTIAYLIKKLLKIPYVLSFHGLDLALAQNTNRKRILLQLIVKNCDSIIANSNYTKQELLKVNVVKNKEIKVIYPCPNIKASRLSDEMREKIIQGNGLKDRRILLTVGRLVERKGQDQVIKALPLVLRKVPNAVYVVVGNGVERLKLENLIEKYHLKKYVMILDDVMDEELPYFYDLSEVFVMPSRRLDNGDVEGFGIVYLEANVFGKPVIAGNSGGAVEAVQHRLNGLVVEPTNTNELAQAIISLFENPHKAKIFGEQGRNRVQEKFSWKTQAQALLKILEI